MSQNVLQLLLRRFLQTLTYALTTGHDIHKENSDLSANDLSRKLRKMGFAFLNEGMAVTENCPNGFGKVIQRRTGVKIWSMMIASLPVYIPEGQEESGKRSTRKSMEQVTRRKTKV